MKGGFALGFALGIVVGGVAAVALLPESEARFRELAARLASIGGTASSSDGVGPVAGRALDRIRERCRLALAEAREAREQKRRGLWSDFDTARRQGRVSR